jgi:cysteine desulfurase
LLSISAHKFYGPKGIGALFVARQPKVNIQPLMFGGGHERGMRSGTLATHQIVGLGAACEFVSGSEFQQQQVTVGLLRDRLWQGIADLPGVSRNGAQVDVLAGHLNVCFAGVDGETLLMSLRRLAVSSGSACNSASMKPSYVLTRMGLSDEEADSSIRFSLGVFNTSDDIDTAIEHIRTVYSRLIES